MSPERAAAREAALAKLGETMLAAAGAAACLEGYGTADPAEVGRLALAYGDIAEDGTFN